MTNVGNGYRTMVIEVCFSFNFAVGFDFNLFPVPPSKAKSIGDVFTKGKTRQLATWFFLQRALPIDAPNHHALRGDARGTEKKIREIKFENYRRNKFRPCCLLAQGTCLSPSITQKTNSNRRRIICCVFPFHGDIA
jgi:hypothetical protein